MEHDQYLAFVKQIAARYYRKVYKSVEFDELVSVGCVAFVEALRRWDQSKGATLEAFVTYRVKGAILDYLRSLDMVTRSERKQIKKTGADPSLVMLHDWDFTKIVASTADPSYKVLVEQLLRHLEPRERYVIRRLFWDEDKVVDIARDLDRCSALVTIIKKTALEKMKKAA